jgi:hypothetical protein
MTRTEIMSRTFNRIFMSRPGNIVQIWPGTFGKGPLDKLLPRTRNGAVSEVGLASTPRTMWLATFAASFHNVLGVLSHP